MLIKTNAKSNDNMNIAATAGEIFIACNIIGKNRTSVAVLRHKDEEVSNNDYDSNISISSSSDEENMETIGLIRNIPNKAAHF